MRGRKPTPTAVKELNGNPGKRPLNEDEPKPTAASDASFAKPPTFLSRDAKAEWARVVPELLEMRVLTEADRGALVAMCRSYGEMVEAERIVRKHGLVELQLDRELYDDDGRPVAVYLKPIGNPAIAIAKEAQAAYLKAAVEFGLTPSSRSRIKAAPAEEKDDDDLPGAAKLTVVGK